MTVKSKILIIGSTGRNTGKTEFACRIIEKQAPRNKIIGIKGIPVDENERDCHRGIEGCGLCTSLTGDYEIFEELGNETSKGIRKVIDPGVFLVIKDFASNYVKQSCAEVIQFADKIIEFNDLNWDFNPDKVMIRDGSWKIQG